jgi:uncharacterized Fe-S center protein
MQKDKVFFVPWDSFSNMQAKAQELYTASELLDVVEQGDKVAVKLHVGELGNPNYIRPFFVKQVVDLIQEKGGKPFLTDTCTYYPLKRSNAVDHMQTAIANGFNFAPFIVADGMASENKISVDSPDPLLPEVEVAGAIHQADCMIVLSHLKGHPLGGFGGAIKNLGMGCVSKNTKLAQHRLVDLEIHTELCQGCGSCVEACWFGLPRIENDVAVIDDPNCMRCPLCSSACPEEAITLSGFDRLGQGLAVAAQGVISTFAPEKIAYVNFATDIGTVCDCAPVTGEYIGSNLGIFAGFSPLSLDAVGLSRIDYQKLNSVHNVNCWDQVQKMSELDTSGSLQPEVIEL